MFKSRKQILTRFLKDNLIYYNIMFEKKLARLVFEREITENFFDNAMSWNSTNEGKEFWLKKQCEFVLFILRYDRNNCFNKHNVIRYFYNLINSGYFFYKGGEYYNNLVNEYKFYSELFGN